MEEIYKEYSKIVCNLFFYWLNRANNVIINKNKTFVNAFEEIN